MSPQETSAYSARPTPRRRRRTDFTVGRIFSTGFSVWSKNFLPFVTLSFLLYIPILALNYFFPPADPLDAALGAEPTPQQHLQSLGTGVLTMLVNQLVTATVVIGVFEQLRGERLSVSESLQRGLGRVLPAIGVALMSGLGVVSILLTCFILGVLLGPLAVLVFPIGAIAALVLYVGWWAAVPVAVVERPGVIASLARSWRLTSGYRFVITGFLLLTILLGWLVAATVLFVFAFLDEWTLVANLVTVVFVSLFAVFTAVGYYQLRVAKEGVDPQELASVFD